MRFSLAALGLFCAAASAAAPEATEGFDSIFKPEKDQIVKTGSTVEVAWSIGHEDLYGDVKVDIQVHGGKDDKSLVLKETVATGIDNSDLKYKWTVGSSLGVDKMYGIRIQLSSNETLYQWSQHFTIKNEGGGSSGSASTASSTETGTGATSTKTTSAAPKETTASATSSTSKGEHATTAAPSSASATGVTTSATNGTTTAVSTVTQSPTPSHGAAAGLAARAGVAGAIVGCVALLAL